MPKEIDQLALQNQLASLMRKVKQPFTVSFNNALCRLKASMPVEQVIFRRRTDEKIEVFLQQRKGKTGDTYPGAWFCPGALLRPGERRRDVLNRVAANELGTTIRRATFVTVLYVQEERGWFCENVYLVVPAGEPKNGRWFSVHRLPRMASNHTLVVKIALKFYRQGLLPGFE